MRRLIFILLCIGYTFVPYTILAQCGNTISINNPSFEGTPQINVSPPNWPMCNVGGPVVSTMPVPPLANLIPANGISYLMLNAADCNPNPCATVFQTLNIPFTPGQSYSFTIEAAVDTHVIQHLPGCVEVEVWGGYSGCNLVQLLWNSGDVNTFLAWHSFTAHFTPNAAYTDIFIRARNMGCPPNGFMYPLVDNMSNIVPATTTISKKDVSCNGACNGLAYVSVSSGLAPYTYLWSNGLVNDSITNLCPGTYSVICTDANGCNSYDTIVITQPPLPLSVTVNVTKPVCNGQLNGSVTSSVVGGTAPYTYLWSNGDTLASLSNMGAGAYSLTVTDTLGCVATIGFVINEPPLLKIDSIVQISPACFGLSNGSITLFVSGGTGSYTFQWFPNVSNTNSANNLPAGNYTVTIRDSLNCFKQRQIILTQPGALQLSPIKKNVSCFQGSDGRIKIGISGGTAPFTFLWSPNVSNTDSAVNLPAGGYSVTVTDANGCSLGISVLLTQPTDLITSLSILKKTRCYGDSNALCRVFASGASPPYSYLWSNGSNNDSLINVPAGFYWVKVIDSKGCYDSLTVNFVSPALLIESPQNMNVLCNGGNTGKIKLNISGGVLPYTYQWQPNVSLNDSAVGLVAGTYTVLVTDSHNCSISIVHTVTEPPALSIALLNQVNVLCNGDSTGQLAYSVSGGTGSYTYQWQPNVSNTSSASLLKAGTNVLTVTDSNGCQKSATGTITEPLPIVATVVFDSATCNLSDGSAALVVGGGVSPYTYLWSNGNVNDTLANVASGTYNLVITDSNNCTKSFSIVVPSVNLGVAFDVLVSADDTCGNGGVASVMNLPNAFPPYLFSWNTVPVQSGSTANGLAAGNYSVTVTDGRGCSSVKQVSIALVNSNNADAGIDIQINSGERVMLNALPDNVQYSWSPTDGLSCSDCQHPEASPLTTTTYTLTTTDVNGCNAIDSITITVNQVNTLFVPDVFSPNGDGKNDVLFVRGSNISEVNFAVYDRWGERVFETRDKNFGWDGTYKGKELSGAVFVYYCIGKYNDGSEFKVKGDVTLVR